MSNIAELVPNKSDHDIASDLKIRVAEAYEPLCKLADEANEYGMALQVTIAPNAFGKFVIQSLQIIKVFK